jgi:hypothetical protein
MATFTGDITVSYNDVYASTGISYNPVDILDKINHAASMIELTTGVFLKADEREIALSVSDAAWIKRAIIFQTVWIIENPDALSRTGVSSLSQDGLSVTAPDSLTFVLAPLARRALVNCTWAKSGTIQVAPADVSNADGSFLTSDAHAWTPMAGA